MPGPVVYPRVCGGNRIKTLLTHWKTGLSPRVRGKLGDVDATNKGRWSIPACAGETDPRASAIYRRQVYPRVCGGNIHLHGPTDWHKGLSPRVRGKRGQTDVKRSGQRSIPACAGETVGVRFALLNISVYPRVCGGN